MYAGFFQLLFLWRICHFSSCNICFYFLHFLVEWKINHKNNKFNEFMLITYVKWWIYWKFNDSHINSRHASIRRYYPQYTIVRQIKNKGTSSVWNRLLVIHIHPVQTHFNTHLVHEPSAYIHLCLQSHYNKLNF